ncbi:MAG: hypothetical protein EB060_11075 [Proteobacteria bacterium]|nr:hypothetical protein [Pseudomonadota bacterium]
MKLRLTINHATEDRVLFLGANDMNELVEKIIKWQTMDEHDVSYYEKKGRLQEEIESGWYYQPKPDPVQ